MRQHQNRSLKERLSTSAFCHFEQRGELPCIVIQHPGFSASLLPQGAQLLSFCPTDDTSWIWLSPTAEYRQGVSLRGGIPICWPWFGNADKNPPEVRDAIAGRQPPAHGFARTNRWTLSRLYEAADRIEIELTLPQSHCIQSVWQGNAELTARWIMTPDSLEMQLITTNTGRSTLAFSQALHTYLPTPDIHTTRIDGLAGHSYIDTMTGWQRKQQQGAVVFQGETDRIYLQQATPLRLVTPQRTLLIHSRGSHSTIVWNPWIEKAQRLSQFDDAAWQTMLCIETANAADDWVNLATGESHCLSMRLSAV
ncbi:D-hexose-6-phosphate mutarotase [Oceanobacter sp. 3_MG-2023]|uniref:D-hexose-6-phosphate mutarotase n=1 Tax=Oceanobacter sp. 3_MG-2023 TaxID=3062622 RepID=UPI002733AE95|nr:D-hexose-6-phosphate mutarotase [Oceanobacter sp. 3_MG-2023]MDP2504437.1 D-hexose-6-phosphate mutarotase [Oceanobacter sp. 3_MG-2023]